MMPRASLEQARACLGEQAAELSDELIQRVGPVELMQQQEQLPQLVGQQRQWAELMDSFKHEQDVIKAAAAIDEPQFDEFLRWWQSQLLDRMKQQGAQQELKRLWDALLKIRRQGQGGNINRLLALEGLFILYAELVMQKTR